MQSVNPMAAEVKAAHEKRVADLREAIARTAVLQAIPPTPTQEENDLLALGLMDIDAKAAPKEPPPPQVRHAETTARGR